LCRHRLVVWGRGRLQASWWDSAMGSAVTKVCVQKRSNLHSQCPTGTRPLGTGFALMNIALLNRCPGSFR
jgi:hypothetical protein